MCVYVCVCACMCIYLYNHNQNLNKWSGNTLVYYHIMLQCQVAYSGLWGDTQFLTTTKHPKTLLLSCSLPITL